MGGESASQPCRPDTRLRRRPVLGPPQVYPETTTFYKGTVIAPARRIGNGEYSDYTVEFEARRSQKSWASPPPPSAPRQRASRRAVGACVELAAILCPHISAPTYPAQEDDSEGGRLVKFQFVVGDPSQG